MSFFYLLEMLVKDISFLPKNRNEQEEMDFTEEKKIILTFLYIQMIPKKYPPTRVGCSLLSTMHLPLLSD